MRREPAGLAASTAITVLGATLVLAFAVVFVGASASCGGDGAAGDDDPIGLPDRDDPDGAPNDAGADAAADAPVTDANQPACDLERPFNPPVRLTELDEATHRSTPRLSADELTLYFTTFGDAGTGVDLGVVTRSSRSSPFGSQKLLDQSGAANDHDPSVAADHLSLWFHSGRNGTADIFTSTRMSTSMPFGVATILPPAVNSPATNENHPYFRAASNELWFISDRPGGAGLYDIYVSIRSGETFAAPNRVVELSSPSEDWQPQPSEDGRTLIFASDRPNGLGKLDLWMAKRASTTAPFGAPTAITELNSAFTEQAGWLSADGCRIWFSSGRNSNDLGQSLFYAERPRP